MIDILIARGYKIVPVDGKRPFTKSWQSHDFTAAEIQRAILISTEPGLGIKLDNLIDLEGDGPTAETIAESLGLPETVSWKSARGVHRLYTLTKSQAQFLLSAGKIKIGDLEIRTGINSQSVMPPSAGRRWITSLETNDPAALPNSIFEHIKAATKERPAALRNEPVEISEQRPGDIFNESATWDEMLVPRGWTKAGDNQWRRPGKDTPGISATTDYCSTDARGGLFYCFSSATEIEPIEPNKSYSKFELYATLEHSGNFAAAAASVMRNGYSPPIDNSCDEFDDFPEIEPNAPERVQIASLQPYNSLHNTKIEPNAPVRVQKTGAKHPRLDLSQFNDPLTKYCLALKDRSAADTGAIWFQCSELFANFIGHDTHFVWSGKKYFLNGSMFLVGPTATGKKGLSLCAARAPFNPSIGGEFSDDIEFATYKRCVAGGFQSGQAIIGHFHKDKNTEGEIDKRLVITEEETATILKMAKLESSILSQVMRTAFDGGTLEYRVSKIKGQGATIFVEDAHVSVIGHITADELVQVLTVGADRTGELNRIQFVLCLDSKFVPEKKSNFLFEDIKELTTLREQLLKCATWAKHKHIKFADDLDEKLDQYTEEHDLDMRAGKERAINARLPLYLRKWISRFAVMDMTSIATISHYQRAMAVIEYLRQSNEWILGEWLDGADKDLIDKAICTIEESQNGASRGEIGRMLFGTHWTVEKVDGVMKHAGRKLEAKGRKLVERKNRNKVIYGLEA